MKYAIFIMTFLLFIIEDSLNFNVGYRSRLLEPEKELITLDFHYFNLYVPGLFEFAQLMSTLITFSILNEILASALQKMVKCVIRIYSILLFLFASKLS